MKTDTELKCDVEAELAWEPAVNATCVGVEVVAGVVTLSGHLNSFVEKWAAERAAERVAGVKGLAIELDVKPTINLGKTDSEIATAAVDHLGWNVSVPSEGLLVKVDNGWVILSGVVDWEFQRRDAATSVRTLIGVRGVSNLIEIRKKLTPPDVTTRIEAALQRSAHVDASRISVKVDEGKVTLEGTAFSVTERQLAADAAWAAPGVTDVINHMHLA